MPSHDWSEKDFDWDSLHKGIRTIWWWCTRIGRIGVHSKEKYGTHRMSTYLWSGSLFGLTHPGYVYNQYPQWLWNFDCSVIRPFFCKLKFPIRIVRKWQVFVLRTVFHYVLGKYPHIAHELVSDVDCYNLIKGGKEIHIGVWTPGCKHYKHTELGYCGKKTKHLKACKVCEFNKEG